MISTSGLTSLVERVQLRGSLDSGEPGADDRDRGAWVQSVDGGPQPLRELEFRYGIRMLGRSLLVTAKPVELQSVIAVFTGASHDVAELCF